jgi:hypothetical protein
VGKPKEKDHLEDLDVGGWIIIKMDFREMGRGGMYWIDLAQDRDQWRAFVNILMSLLVT